MRLGVVASDLPPAHGGIQQHADGVLRHLPDRFDLLVFARSGAEIVRDSAFERRLLVDRLEADVRAMQRESVEAWLFLSAEGCAFAPKLAAPVFVYVHGNDFIDPWRPSTRATRLTRRVFTALRAPGSGMICRALRKSLIVRGSRRVRHVYANSRSTAERLRAQTGLPADRVSVVAPGISATFLDDEGPRARRSGRPLRLITIARLDRATRRKNVDGLLAAVAMLRADHELELVVVGSGDDAQRLHALAETLGVSDVVRFAGRAPDAVLKQLLRESDLFVLPVRATSRDVEGFGMVYVEAAAAGLPSLAVRGGGVDDAVRDGISGILLDDPSPASIAAGIARFVTDRAQFDPVRIRDWARCLSAPQTTADLARHLEAEVSRPA